MDKTAFKIELDDEAMERLLAQSIAARQPPRDYLSAMVAVGLRLAESGQPLVQPSAQVRH